MVNDYEVMKNYVIQRQQTTIGEQCIAENNVSAIILLVSIQFFVNLGGKLTVNIYKLT